MDRDDGRNRLHIISFAPNVDIDQLMAAASHNFAAAGDPPFPADAASQIKAFAAPYRTQAIIDSYIQKQQEIAISMVRA